MKTREEVEKLLQETWHDHEDEFENKYYRSDTVAELLNKAYDLGRESKVMNSELKPD